MISPAKLANRYGSCAPPDVSRIRIVDLFTTSTPAIPERRPAAADGAVRSRSRLAFTAFALSGVPSLNLTSVRIFHVIVLPSFDVFHDVAIIGLTLLSQSSCVKRS